MSEHTQETESTETISIFKSLFTSYKGGGVSSNPIMVKQALISIASLAIIAGVDYLCKRKKSSKGDVTTSEASEEKPNRDSAD